MQNPQEIHEARAYAYQLLQSVFGVRPTAEQLDVVGSQTTLDAYEALGLDVSHDGAVANLSAAARNADIEELDDAFARLFVGPAELVAAPWESVYVNRQRLLLQESTIEVRHAYTAQGFIPQGFPHVADDHIALELDFMKRLAVAAAEDETRRNERVSASADFIEKHLERWVRQFAASIEKAGCEYYSWAGKLLVELVAADAKLLAS